MDERTLNEIYYKSFEIALKAKPWTVMCSYNPVNGVYVSENKKLLNDVLRKRFGFDGLIMSDWWAVHNGYKAVRAGLNLRMPFDSSNFSELKTAFEKGYLTEEEIDESVSKVLNLAEKVDRTTKKKVFSVEDRHKNAIRIAEEGIVLLKNEDEILPIKNRTIAISGLANERPIIGGGGSSAVKTDYIIPSLSSMLKKLQKKQVDYSVGITENTFSNAKTAFLQAFKAEVAIVVVGDGPNRISEGYDRDTIKLRPEQEAYINEIAKYNKNVIVVIESGGAVDVSAFEHSAKAIIFAGYAGEGVNEALANIITGRISPSGKLAETFPCKIEDTYMKKYTGDGLTVEYNERIFVGYRYFERYNISVKYPFGYGLSYARFEYKDLKIEKKGETDFIVSYTIKNVSNVEGKEVSQVYVRDVISMVSRPIKELKGYSKDLIKPGESKQISIKLDFSAFSYYSVALGKWYVENGEFEIAVGASSQDLRLVERVNIALPDNEQFSSM